MSHARLYIAQNISKAPLPKEVQMATADVRHVVCDMFGIGDARILQEQAYQRPSTKQQLQFVVSFSSITIEAQNALLKLLEEPPVSTLFHIVVPRRDMLIPTVQSRLEVVAAALAPVQREALRSFLTQTPGERMSEIAARTKAKDNVWVEAVVSGAEEYAHCQKGVTKERVLREVIHARSYLNTRGAAKKMLLESLALVLPVKR